MKNRRCLSLGTTPCPNDSYLLGALATGQVQLPGTEVQMELLDIEQLNQRVLAGSFDVAKISCAIYPEVADDYAVLEVGAALADGYGPLVLARSAMSADDLVRARIVAPGAHTTGAMLFRHWAPRAAPLSYRSYDRIIDGLLGDEFDAGVVIHESRFTYQDAGLSCLVDLGTWWQSVRALPVPLGCYVMRRSLVERYAEALEHTMRCALRLAASGEARINDWIREHAQEMDEEITRQHIALYVNDYTWQLGSTGRAAIAALGAGPAR